VGFVRPARPGDAVEIARVQVATWRTAYRRLFPRHVLDQLDENAIAESWRDAIVAPPSDRHRVLVAIEQPADGPGPSYVVGFAAFGPADEDHTVPGESADPELAAITELLVEPRWGRRGHGSRLLAAVVDHWRDDGLTSALAWVFDQDPATRAFLTSAGWAPDGQTRALDVDDMLIAQSRFAALLPPR
jgi:GNAT superfamily N-acetyltransferase